jgi:uncharacterized protein (TIGR00730 family)
MTSWWSSTSFLQRELVWWKDCVIPFLYALEFLPALWHFRGLPPLVVVYGSARIDSEHSFYQQVMALGRQLASAGHGIMTGGGPGLMEAANRGAKEGGGYSVGCNILLPFEQRPNRFLDRYVTVNQFFIRKIMFTKYAKAIVVCPGGVGTLDEVFEILTLIQTKKINPIPIIFFGQQYWSKLADFLQESLAAKMIEPELLQLLQYTDDPQVILKML